VRVGLFIPRRVRGSEAGASTVEHADTLVGGAAVPTLGMTAEAHGLGDGDGRVGRIGTS